MQIQDIEDQEKVDQTSEALDLFGADVTPESLENYVRSNYSTSAQASLMTALLLAGL